MKRIRVCAVAAGVVGLAITAPAAAVSEQGATGGASSRALSLCADLRAAAAKDASLSRTIQRVQADVSDKRATRAVVLASLKRTGALKQQPDLAIETVVAAPDAAGARADASVAGVKAEAEMAVTGLCIRAAWGPGKVNWTWSNPQAYPYYYSYKPESATALKWASAPDDSLDAMYKRSWARCTALKVPDSATITVNSNGSWSKCENAAMAALGHVVKWVNTCSGPEGSFPDDGL